MKAVRLPDGRIRVPARAESPGALGDGVETIGPGHPDFAAWDRWLRRVNPDAEGSLPPRVQKAKDAAGHEHAADGRFTGAGGGRAAAAAEVAGKMAQRWKGDDAGGQSFSHRTSSGAEYTADLQPLSKWEGMKRAEMLFSDAGGSYGITGAGGAAELFRVMSAAAVSAVKEGHAEALQFSAREPSRRRLYDRLVRTIAGALPDHVAVAYEPSGGNHGGDRVYIVMPRAKADEIGDDDLREMLPRYERLVKALPPDLDAPPKRRKKNKAALVAKVLKSLEADRA